MLRKLVLISLALCFSCDILVFAAKQKENLIFDGNGKVILALGKNFKVDILQKDKNAKFELPDATEATVTGTKLGSDFTLDISYDKEIAGDSDGAKLTKAQLKFDIKFDQHTGYWTLKALTANYKGSLDASTQFDIKDEALDVTSNPGATSKVADQICGRGHLTCAPKNLCWACDAQIFKDKNSGGQTQTSRLTMPGARLQPVFSGNGTLNTSFKFGYEWDCDPLIPLAVWVGLLLTLVLATFLYWATDMLVSLQTPNRFDDPRGKPLNVPTSD